MKKLTVISGKGGTGKTTVTANLAALAQDLVVADCDVDAPNLHLLLEPDKETEEKFVGAKQAVKDNEKCIDCGKCREVCNFGAVKEDFSIDPIKCEGCGLCVALCPEEALSLEPEETGEIYFSQAKTGTMVHAQLKIGAENSGKLVSEVKEKAEAAAAEEERDLLLVDGSPGIGCPVIASLNGVDAALIVTEPTKSGLSDLKRVVQVTDHFSIPAWVVINKHDLNPDLTAEIRNFCLQEGISVIGQIPYSQVIVEVMRQGQLIVENKADSKPAQGLNNIWREIKNRLFAASEN